MAAARRFSKPVLAALDEIKYLGIRSGDEHRFIAVWPVVVKGRVFVRSWSDKPTGWYRAFLEEPRGAVQLKDGRVVRVRARPLRSQALIGAMEDAYAEKYPTPGSRRYVVGFRRPKRRATSMELVPR
jgi:hypothetical protein